MNVPDANLDVGLRVDIWTPRRSAGTMRMPPSVAEPPMIATQLETASGSAGGISAAALGAADWLCLAAAPTFAIMALLTGVLDGGPSDMLCSAAHGASPLSGMIPMYLLMSAFHSADWLKLISRRRSGARPF
jgi:hypothetical protein